MHTTIKRIALLTTLLFALGITGTAGVTATKPDPNHKVTVCHALPTSASHPFNRITVDIASSGYVRGGHSRSGGALGNKHANGGDIIPPYTYQGFRYPGQNWTTAGRAIYENGCRTPPPPPERVTFDPNIRFRVCGDPRLLITVNNRRSTVRGTFSFIYQKAQGGTGRILVTVPAGERNVLYPRWVVGQSTVWYQYWPGGKNAIHTAQSYAYELPPSTGWGKGYCPKNLNTAVRQARLH